ncbi:MAG: thermopsin family protease [Thermoplasmata archaeon]
MARGARPNARLAGAALGAALLLVRSLPLVIAYAPTVGAPLARTETGSETTSAGFSPLGPGVYPPRSHADPRISGPVDPYAYFSSEPAPIGIADFGVDPDNGTGFAYSTSVFEGNAAVENLTTYHAELSRDGIASNDAAGLQLNVVLRFDSGTTTFAFWIQDVAELATGSGLVAFVDNVWNLTSAGAPIPAGTLSGNGSIEDGGLYVASAGGQTGNDLRLSDPYSIDLRVRASDFAGSPPGRLRPQRRLRLADLRHRHLRLHQLRRGRGLRGRRRGVTGGGPLRGRRVHPGRSR